MNRAQLAFILCSLVEAPARPAPHLHIASPSGHDGLYPLLRNETKWTLFFCPVFCHRNKSQHTLIHTLKS